MFLGESLNWIIKSLVCIIISIGQYTGNIYIPVTLLRIPFYQYFINYIFLWLRSGHEIINRVANT